MKNIVLLISILLVLKIECYQTNNYIKIDTTKYNGSVSEIIYKSKIFLPSLSGITISVDGLNLEKYNFGTMEVHSQNNLSVTLESNHGDSISHNGTDVGFIIKFKPPSAKKFFRLTNNNFDSVICLVIFSVYKESAPIPTCMMDTFTISTLDTPIIIEGDNYLTAISPVANHTSKNSCENSTLNYETYYTYIDVLDFSVDAYFDGIERMIFDNIFATYQTKYVPLKNKHLFETIPGRGLVINTVVRNENGEYATYIPIVTYSCPKNTWGSHCTDMDNLKRGISIVLLIHSIVMALNLMSPDFIESILNGMLYGGFGMILFIKSYEFEIQTFDYFIVILISAFFSSALFGTVSLYVAIGRYLSKFTFSTLMMIFVMEIFFNGIISPYLQVIAAILLLLIFSFIGFTFSVFLGCLIFILNVSYLSKIGNLHRIVMNNFLAMMTLPSDSTNETYFDFIRTNYINYSISLNLTDYGLIIFYVFMSIYLTVRKERFFFVHPTVMHNDNIFSDSQEIRAYNCEVGRQRNEECFIGIRRTSRGGFRIYRCRRHLHFGHSASQCEHTPLISHWVDAIEDNENDFFYTPPGTSSSVKIKISSESDEEAQTEHSSHESDEQLHRLET